MSPVKIVLLIAVILAVVGAFVAIPYIGLAFAILGIAAAVLNGDNNSYVPVLVTAVALTTVASAFGSIPVAGEYLTAILSNISAYVNALAATAIVLHIKDNLTA